MKKHITLALSLAALSMSTNTMADSSTMISKGLPLNGISLEISTIYMSSSSNGLIITPKQKRNPNTGGMYLPSFSHNCEINTEFYLPLSEGDIGTRMHSMLDNAMQNNSIVTLYSDKTCDEDPTIDGRLRPVVVTARVWAKNVE